MLLKLTLFVLIGTVIGALLVFALGTARRPAPRRQPKVQPIQPWPEPPPQRPQENLEDLLASIRATQDPLELFHLVGRATTLPAAAQQECIAAAHAQFATRIA